MKHTYSFLFAGATLLPIFAPSALAQDIAPKESRTIDTAQEASADTTTDTINTQATTNTIEPLESTAQLAPSHSGNVKLLEEQVVTASGYKQHIKEAPASISIISQEEILTRPIRDIGDAVQDVPGVYVEQDKTGQNTISMRGLDYNYVLILIDGKRQNTTRGFIQRGFGNQTSLMPPPSMIERIEVIRGPASIIYGSDAMGGVINIITKKHTNTFTSGIQTESKIFEPSSEWGNAYGTNTYMNLPLIQNVLSLNLRGAFRYNEQNAFLTPSWVTPNAAKNPYAAHSATGSRNLTAGFRINYTPTSNDYIYLDSEVFNGRFGSLNTSSRSVTSVQELYKVNSVLSHDGSYTWGKLSSYIQHGYNVIAPHVGVNNGALPIGADKGASINWASKRVAQSAIAQSTYTNTLDLHTLGALIANGGVYYAFESLVGAIDARHYDMAQNQAAIFAEGEWLANQYISTTFGARYNHSDRFANTINPRFYVNVNPSSWLTIKLGVANGMLIPTLLQTVNGVVTSTSTTTGTNDVYGNPTLKPEQSWNYELSGIIDTNPAMLILTGYYTDFTNQIETLQGITGGALIPEINRICPGSGTVCATYRNIDRSLVTGVEFSARIKPLYGISLDTSYGYTYTEALSGQGKGEPINSIPRHSITITPKYDYRDFSIYARWSGRFETPTPYAGTAARTNVRTIVGKYYKDYQLVDIAASYKFSRIYALTFAINNVFDVNFMDYTQVSIRNSRTNTITTSAQNTYQRILPSRNYWLSVRADF